MQPSLNSESRFFSADFTRLRMASLPDGLGEFDSKKCTSTSGWKSHKSVHPSTSMSDQDGILLTISI